MEVIYQGTTWRRTVTLVDAEDPPEPLDPDELAAVVVVPARATDDCEATTVAVTVTGPDDPGVYELSLTAAETADLPAQMLTRWELVGTVTGDVVPLERGYILVQPAAARIT